MIIIIIIIIIIIMYLSILQDCEVKQINHTLCFILYQNKLK